MDLEIGIKKVIKYLTKNINLKKIKKEKEMGLIRKKIKSLFE